MQNVTIAARKRQGVLFDGARLTLEQAIEKTADTLRAFRDRYDHWVMAYSGGKDSTTAITVILRLIEEGRVNAPQTLTVMFADTRQESPPLYAAALDLLTLFKSKGAQIQIVHPPLDKRFLVYILGRGVAPPHNHFRWCTEKIKVQPMTVAVKTLKESAGRKLLLLTGVRLGESAARDQRIITSCTKSGTECGQGWFQEMSASAADDKLAPILHWRVCHVSDWLEFYAPDYGYPTRMIWEAYGVGRDESDPIEIAGRTGCLGCPLIEEDFALTRITRLPNWNHLTPLFELRPLYEWMRRPDNRLRMDRPGPKFNKLGPLTLEARAIAFEQILDIQTRINQDAEMLRRPAFELLNAEEVERIRHLQAARTWPKDWTGSEPRGDAQLIEHRQLRVIGSLFPEEEDNPELDDDN